MAVEDVRAILFDLAPEFATSDTAELARVDRFIGYAQTELDVARWTAAEARDEVATGAYLNRGLALLTAHKLSVADRAGQTVSGPVQSEKVGGVSVTYAASATATGPMDGTSYGQEFAQFRRIVFPGAWAV